MSLPPTYALERSVKGSSERASCGPLDAEVRRSTRASRRITASGGPQASPKCWPCRLLSASSSWGIWDSITEIPEALRLTAAQEAELDHRIEAYRNDPTAGSPWPEIRARILKRAWRQAKMGQPH